MSDNQKTKPSLSNPLHCATALVLNAVDRNADSLEFKIHDTVIDGQNLGNWVVTVTKVS